MLREQRFDNSFMKNSFLESTQWKSSKTDGYPLILWLTNSQVLHRGN